MYHLDSTGYCAPYVGGEQYGHGFEITYTEEVASSSLVPPTVARLRLANERTVTPFSIF